MNSQQKGGEEPCPAKQPLTSQVSTAAPTSDPEGAATQESAINDAFLELGEPSLYKSVLRKLVAKVTATHEHELREENQRLKKCVHEEWDSIAADKILTDADELREECERLRNTLTTVKELLPTRERALFRDGNSSTPIGVHTISEAKVIRIRAAIDAAMQPSEEGN